MRTEATKNLSIFIKKTIKHYQYHFKCLHKLKQNDKARFLLKCIDLQPFTSSNVLGLTKKIPSLLTEGNKLLHVTLYSINKCNFFDPQLN